MNDLPVPDDIDAVEALDRAAMRATAARDRPAFEALYRRHHRRLARFLQRYTQRRDLIDDVYNETMWVVWRRAEDFRYESKVSTWITGIAYRCMLAALRDAAAGPALADLPLDAGALDAYTDRADDSDAQRELRDWLDHGLRTLPADQRLTLELAYVLGHSCEEIAQVMECPVGTVKARMFHARVRLRNVLPTLGGQATPPADAAQG